MPELVTLHSALPDSPGGAVPEWLHLVPAGTFRTNDGRGPYTLADPEAVITASMAGGKLPIDENHTIDASLKSGGGAHPARGWITEMQSRPDGIHGRVKWTAAGKQLLTNEEYRGFSPAFFAPGGTVTRIARGSLTNLPNLPDLATLHTEQDPTLDIVKARAALGLPETADEAAVLAAMTAGKAALTTHSALVLNAAQAAGITATTGEELITALRVKAATSVSPDAVLQMQTQLDTMKKSMVLKAATDFVDGAIKAGKPIVAKRAELIELHTTNAAMVEGLVNGMPSINAGGVVVETQAQQGDELTADEKAVAKKMGVSEEDMKAEKKKAKGAAK